MSAPVSGTGATPEPTPVPDNIQNDGMNSEIGNGAGYGPNRRRNWAISAVFALFFLAGVGVALYWALVWRWVESTDDAYVGGNVVQITPQVSGVVLAIAADDTDFVKAGQTVVELDKADARVALDQAEIQLARAVREVRNLMATTGQLEAGVMLRQSEIAKAEEDLARREGLTASGAVSGEEVQHARDAIANTRAARMVAEQQLAAHRTLVDRTTVESHPAVRGAAAKVREAYLGYARTELPAPVSGFVARRNVQVGQRVIPGAHLMAVIALEQVWVDANFKESQLANLRAGQPAKLVADAYGSAIEYRGRVVGFSAGTGSAFALLPPQNATGNWIKVVQRVPVRIALDPAELAKHPLRLGLSMEVEVDTHERGGDRLPRMSRIGNAYETTAFASLEDQAARRVAAIIAANSADARATPGPRAREGQRP